MSAYKNEDLYTSLLELAVINETKLKKALEEANHQSIPLEDVLLSSDLISPHHLGVIIGELISVPYIQLSTISIPPEVLQIIPEKVARKQHIISYLQEGHSLRLAMNDPSDSQMREFLARKTGMEVTVSYTTKQDLEHAYSLYLSTMEHVFAKLIQSHVSTAKNQTHEDPPIIKIVDLIIDHAYQTNASDIHIEPLEHHTLVRFRIDGVLHDMAQLPHELDIQIVTRIKVMSNMRTDEHLEAQDGNISLKRNHDGSADGQLDMRVSIVPITRGEKVVMRLLSERSQHFSLIDLGFSPADLKKIELAYQMPHGMILTTGPTGSGKTTTLYAILKLLNNRSVNIMTIEDPVEYQLENINQIQVNTKTDLTFANGLRSIVRQDPDVILVGEIRDEETASIAINSAMTGHLVLSTLHTNDAVTAFPRLIDMHVEPFLISSTVNVIIAQRLVRMICAKCRVSCIVKHEDLHELIKRHVKPKEDIQTYYGKGCALCHQTGYLGRIGIFEVLTMSEELKTDVSEKNPSTICRNEQ